MKRKIAVLAAVLLAIGLTACGNKETQRIFLSNRNHKGCG